MMELQDLVAWLRGVEDLACTAYSGAAKTAVATGSLEEFLERLAADESLHYHLMGSAAELIRQQDHSPVSAIMVDEETRSRVESPLRDLHKKIDDRNLTECDILAAIVESETSEWNEIFLYVINKCTEMSAEFQYMAAAIQSHERRIEEYLQSKGIDLSQNMKKLPEIWENSLLVVDDDDAVRALFEHFLSRFGQVTSAENGEIALGEIERKFFNVILSDVDMPVLDGISLLRRVVEKEPRLRSHFIICTGNPTPDVLRAVEEHNIPLLRKPITISAIGDAVQHILESL